MTQRPREDARVSVIIPCFNCAGTLRRAVDSVAAQTWRPLEVLLVDDASDDDTAQILAELAQDHLDGWVRVIPLTQNRGPAYARNRAWEVARAPLVAFLDADDRWHPRKLELQCGFMLRHPTAALTSHQSETVEDGATLSTDIKAPMDASPITAKQLVWKNTIATRTVVLKRDVPFRFDERKRRCEDYLLWLEMAFAGLDMRQLDLSLSCAFKAPFGEGGLTKSLWKMQAAELDTYQRLRREGLLSRPRYAAAVTFSTIRFARRLGIASARQLA